MAASMVGRPSRGGVLLSLPLLVLFIISFILLSPLPNTTALTVHLVPHTHDDVGWLKTFEQYYLGLNNSLQQAGVQYILDSTIAALLANPQRKFIYGEQAFFSRWWKYQSESTKASVRQLVAERRLEFVNGGWCMHDEATTHYIDMVDQTTLGHLFILQEFGEAANPRVGWQIDPFGHSATHASLLTAELGLDATFFTKYDYQDHSIRRATKELELIWRPSPALGQAGQVWTGTFPNLGDYGPPPELCFDYFCQSTSDDPVQADPALEDYNLDKKVAAFLRYAQEQASVTKGDPATMNIMFYLGRLNGETTSFAPLLEDAVAFHDLVVSFFNEAWSHADLQALLRDEYGLDVTQSGIANFVCRYIRPMAAAMPDEVHRGLLTKEAASGRAKGCYVNPVLLLKQAEQLVREDGWRLGDGTEGVASRMHGVAKDVAISRAFPNLSDDQRRALDAFLIKVNRVSGARAKTTSFTEPREQLLALSAELDAGKEEEVKYPGPFDMQRDAIDTGKRRAYNWLYSCRHCTQFAQNTLLRALKIHFAWRHMQKEAGQGDEEDHEDEEEEELSDFQYEAAGEYFSSLDILIDAVNAAGANVTAQYSTPSLYTYARHAEALTWSVKTDDFFPYGISEHAYRTGFYTSRPALKRYVRVLSHWLQAARQLEVVTGGDGSGTRQLWEAVAVAQHHDAVSGTERQHVAYNYAYLLAKGAAPAYQTAATALAGLSTLPGGQPVSLTICPLLNVSLCPPSQSSALQVVVLYNSQSRNVSTTVRLPSNSSSVQLFDAAGRAFNASTFDVVPALLTEATPVGAAGFDVYVQVQVPAMGWTTLFYQAGAQDQAATHRHSRAGAEAGEGLKAPPVLRWALSFNSSTGMLESVTDTQTKQTYSLRQEFLYYPSMQDNGQNSGAYIFRPAKQSADSAMVNVSNTFINNTSAVSLVYQRISPWISQTISQSSTSSELVFDWVVGPIDVSDEQGKEVITRFTTGIANNATWYTDSNGREFQQRIRNYRATYPWQPTEPTAGNYFPVTSTVWMADPTQALVINVDRSEGASSLVDSQLELMLHRRTLRSDDGETVEALNETDAIEADGRTRIGRGLVVKGRFTLSLVSPSQAAMTARTGHLEQYAPVIPFFAPITAVADYLQTHVAQWTFMAGPLPPQVELITMQALGDGRVLIRLAHMYGVGEDTVLSGPATVNLLAMFVRPVVDVVELSLSGNSAAGSHVPLKWKTNEEGVEAQTRRRSVKETFDGVAVTISAMEVRTFAIRFG